MDFRCVDVLFRATGRLERKMADDKTRQVWDDVIFGTPGWSCYLGGTRFKLTGVVWLKLRNYND